MHYSVSVFSLCTYNDPFHKIPSTLSMRDWTAKLLERSLYSTKWLQDATCRKLQYTHVLLLSVSQYMCRKWLVYMHPCCHSFVKTHLRGSAVTFSTRERLHGKMPVLWATMNVLPHRVTFWLFTASEKMEEKENILGRRKNAHSAVRICAKINSGILLAGYDFQTCFCATGPT